MLRRLPIPGERSAATPRRAPADATEDPDAVPCSGMGPRRLWARLFLASNPLSSRLLVEAVGGAAEGLRVGLPTADEPDFPMGR